MMEKRGFVGLLVKIALFLILASTMIFYIVSIKNSNQAAISARTTLKTFSGKVENIAKDIAGNYSIKNDSVNNSVEDSIKIGKKDSSPNSLNISNLTKETIRITR